MALKLEDLDAILGYDPDSHSVRGIPTMAAPVKPGDLPATMQPGINQAAPTAAPRAIPSMSAPDVPAPTAAPGLPGTLGGASPGIPSLTKPPNQSLGHRILSGIGKVGEVAGDVLAPGITAMIPGTQLNKDFEQKREANLAGKQSETGFRNAETANVESQTAARDKPAVVSTAWQPMGEPRQDPNTGQWSQLGSQKDPTTGEQTETWKPLTGGPGVKPAATKPPTSEEDKQWMATAEENLAKGAVADADRTRLAGLQRSTKLGGIGPEIISQVGEPPVPADFPKGKNDPEFKKADAAWGKEAERLKNQEAGASGEARGAGYNLSRPVQVLDENGNIRYVTAGTAEQQGLAGAGEATKVMSKQAQFNDIVNASQNVRKAISAGGNLNWEPSQVAKLTLAMHETDPTVMATEISNLATSGLNPNQQDLVTWLQQLQERALSLRNIAGMGQGSETTRNAILKALPGITSGNQQMALKQLDALDNMVGNLQKGIAKAKGAPERMGEGGFKAPEGAPAAPTEDGSILRNKKTGKVEAVSRGGQWAAPPSQ